MPDAHRGYGEIEISTLQKLAGVTARRGELQVAATYAVRAIHLTRTRQPSVNRACLVLGTSDVGDVRRTQSAVADLFAAEARALVRGDAVRALATATSFADVLSASGQYSRAHDLLDGLEGIGDDVRPEYRSAVEISYANLLDAEGRER